MSALVNLNSVLVYTMFMASSGLFRSVMLFVLIASNAASDENADNDKKDVAVKAEVELSEESEDKKGSTEATEKNRDSQETAEVETAWEEDPKTKQVDPNLDGLILLGCIVGLVLFIVILRYVCCTIEQCEETLKAKRSLATKDTCKVEHTEREIIMLGMKYKSLV